MENTKEMLLPSPDFRKKESKAICQTHFLTPSGMSLLPRIKQPPPVYGLRGSTVPSKFLVTPKTMQEEKPQERHFCEPCDMEFHSLNDFRRHRTQHERCPVDGCKYKAHPSMMDKHVTELHTSGIFEKIQRTSTPEEIAAWREERRKKYPTLANTQLRQLAQEQRQRRGERLQENNSRFGRHEDKKRARNIEKAHEQREGSIVNKERKKHGRDRRQRKVGPTILKQNVQPLSKTMEQENTIETIIACGLPMFEGTSKMEEYEHETPKEHQIKNELFSFVGMYGSDIEDDESDVEGESKISANSVRVETFSKTIECANGGDHQPASFNTTDVCNDIEIATTKNDNLKVGSSQATTEGEHMNSLISTNMKKNSDPQNCATRVMVAVFNTYQNTNESSKMNNEDKSLQNSSDEAPEESPIERSSSITPAIAITLSSTSNLDTEISTSRVTTQNNQIRKLTRKRKYGLDYRKLKLRKQNTMLEKLLEPDIRHERNILLQCVRFVCQNNFFGIRSKETLEKMQ